MIAAIAIINMESAPTSTVAIAFPECVFPNLDR